jgi:hypothetical protein
MATVTDINALENSIQAIVVAASGYSGALVIWEGQNNPAPGVPYLSLFSEDLPRIGSPEETVTDNPAPVSGQEILLKSAGLAEVEIRVRAFTPGVVSTAAAKSARAVLLGMRQALEAESMTAAIEAAGLTLVSLGSVLNLPRVLETQYQGRATLTLRFRYADQFEEATTFIETAESTGTYS